jgi:uncharacterized protein (TIGR03437 family)
VRSLVLALLAATAAAPQTIVPTALRFEPNNGQTDARAQFVARSTRYNIFLTRAGAVLAPRNSAEGIRIRFVGSHAAPLEGAAPLPGVVNYFRGAAPARTKIPTYQRALQHNVYPGIDAVFHGEEGHGEEGQLEYDFLVAPGADPSLILLEFDGARSVQLNDRGELELATAAGMLTQRKPVLWQNRNGKRIPVDGRYEPRGARQFGLVVAEYDRTKPLIVDPTLVFFTSVGGGGPDQVNGLALDPQGNIYMAGSTASLDFPVVNGGQAQLGHAYAYRLDPGAAPQRLNGIEAGVTSWTVDPKAPNTVYATTQNGVLKTTDAGATWSMLAGGLPAGVTVSSVVIDPSNSQVLYAILNAAPGIFKSSDAGATWVSIANGITNSAFYGAVLTIDPHQPSHLFLNMSFAEFQSTDAGVTWTPYAFRYDTLAFDPNIDGLAYASTPVGGVSFVYKSTDGGVTWTVGTAIGSPYYLLLVDPFHSATLYGVVYAQGIFKSTDSGVTWKPLTVVSSGIARVAADPGQPGTLYVSTFQGALYKSTDSGSTFTPLGLAGLTATNFAVSSNSTVYLATQASTNVFVTKLDPTGKTILYSTYLGGEVTDVAAAIQVDAQGNAYVTGITESPDFPVTSSALKAAQGTPGFVLKLDPTGGKLVYSATIDGARPAALQIDSQGDAYVTGASQGGLPITKDAYYKTEPTCLATGLIGCLPRTDGFAFKLNPSGSSLIYATYLNHLTTAFGDSYAGDFIDRAMAVDSAGDAYLTGVSQVVDKLSPDGSSLIYSAALGAIGRGITLDSRNDVYVTGPGVLVAKLDPNGAKVFSKTLGDINSDSGQQIALDSLGNIVIAGDTFSPNFPLLSPLQGMFAPNTAFLARVDGSASNLLFSTYVGDSRNFILSGLALDSSDRAIISGTTFAGGTNSPQMTLDAFVSMYDMSDIPSVRLDHQRNAASLEGVPLSPGEIIAVDGVGFGTAANTQLLFDGTPAALLSVTATRLTAVAPYALDGRTYTQAQVQSSGTLSNPVWLRVAPTSPGIYSADGSGSGQALAFNADGTPNSAGNPAAVGSTITFYATGVGQTIPAGMDGVLHRGAQVAPADPASIYIGGVYVSGPQYSVGPVAGFPADVFTVKAVVPNTPFITLPSLVQLQIQIGGVPSQGIAPFLGSSTVQVAIKQN